MQDLLTRQWQDLLARPSGPFSFRFLLQPAMVIVIAIHDGLKDARAGRTPYFWTIVTNRNQRDARIRDGLHAISRVLLLGFIIDTIYQYVALKAFYPVEAVFVAFALALVPYLLIRGPADRLANWWHHRHGGTRIQAPKR